MYTGDIGEYWFWDSFQFRFLSGFERESAKVSPVDDLQYAGNWMGMDNLVDSFELLMSFNNFQP